MGERISQRHRFSYGFPSAIPGKRGLRGIDGEGSERGGGVPQQKGSGISRQNWRGVSVHGHGGECRGQACATRPSRREQCRSNGFQPDQLGNGFHADPFRKEIYGSLLGGQRALQLWRLLVLERRSRKLEGNGRSDGRAAVWEKLRQLASI